VVKSCPDLLWQQLKAVAVDRTRLLNKFLSVSVVRTSVPVCCLHRTSPLCCQSSSLCAESSDCRLLSTPVRERVFPNIITPILLSIISTKEVMFSSAWASFFVCLLAGLRKNTQTDFHKIRWKGGTRQRKKTIRFWC